MRKLLIVLLLGVLAGCTGAGTFVVPKNGDEPCITINATQNCFYRTQLYGMPCILLSGYHQGGITCDWSKYRGE